MKHEPSFRRARWIAAQAQVKVYPAVAHLQTLLTTPGVRLDLLDLIKMSPLAHSDSPFVYVAMTAVRVSLKTWMCLTVPGRPTFQLEGSANGSHI